MQTPTHLQPAATPRRAGLFQRLAWVYAGLFLFVVVIGYLPGLTNSEGQLLGLFRIELVDDALHLGSAIWAALAAWISTRASILYFKLFGTVYTLDGVIGLLFGQGYLDGGILIHGPTPLDWMTKLAANFPHLAIGGIAMIIGFVLSRRYANWR
jgi:hypothetical protein